MMTANQDNDAGSSMAAILAAVSTEMALAAQACGELDGALGQILEGAPPEVQMAAMQKLHMVDLLAQHITAVTDFTHRLALIASKDDKLVVEDALSAITLGAVADRLRGTLDSARAS
jgi:hypothetical protein